LGESGGDMIFLNSGALDVILIIVIIIVTPSLLVTGLLSAGLSDEYSPPDGTVQ